MPERVAPAVHSPQPPNSLHSPHDPLHSPHDPLRPAQDPLHSPHDPLRPAHDALHPAAAGEAPPLLSRRVPQAHLAPELRRRGQGPAAPAAAADGSLPDAAEARAALSRYQASRQAARAMVDEGGPPAGRPGDTGHEHPTAGGWS